MSRYVVRPSLLHVLPGLALAALAAVPTLSHAQAVTASSRSVGTFMAAPAGSGGLRLVASGGASVTQTAPSIAVQSGAATISRQLSLVTPTGGSLKAGVSGLLNRGAAARIVTAGLRGSVYLAAGVAMYEVAKAAGWIVSKDSQGNTVFVPPATETASCDGTYCYQYAGADGLWYPSIQAAAQSFVDRPMSDQCPSAGFNYYGRVVSATPTWVEWGIYSCATQSQVDSYGLRLGSRIVDNPSGGPVAPSTPEAFQQALEAQGLQGPYAAQALADAAAISPIPASDLEPLTVTGPATTPIGTTTTTAPDGKTTTKRVTDRHTYSGSTVTTTRETVTETYDPATGQTTTATETQTIEQPAPSTTPAEVPEPCKGADAGTVGCMEPGQAPDSEDLRKEEKDVDFESVKFASSAGCPAPAQISAFGHSYAISWDPMCDAMGLIKTLVLLLAGFAAAWIFSDGFKVT